MPKGFAAAWLDAPALPPAPAAPSADAINIMLHVQRRPGTQPGAPRHGYEPAEGTEPSYSGAGALLSLFHQRKQVPNSPGPVPNCLLLGS